MRKAYCILGMGRSGKAALALLKRLGHKAFVCDDAKAHLPLDSSFLKHSHTLILSPGIPLSHPFVQEARALGLTISGEIQIACEQLENHALAITGSNGKSTVTKLLTEFFQYAGCRAHSVGNIGAPMSEYVRPSRADLLLVELSSFQLETLSAPVFSGAVLLNLSPDHLDRHSSFEDYAEKKEKLAELLKEGASLYLDEDWPRRLSLAPGRELLRFGFSERADLQWGESSIFFRGKELLPLPKAYIGRKDFSCKNILALVGLFFSFMQKHPSLYTGDIRSFIAEHLFSYLDAFQKDRHRLEHVDTIDGVAYYNDSKATNPAAAAAAIYSLLPQAKKIYLLAGGDHKGLCFQSWRSFEDSLGGIFCFGKAKELLQKELKGAIPCEALEEAFHMASSLARRGDIVLLSPGCASFDQFKSFLERGELFCDLVKKRGRE